MLISLIKFNKSPQPAYALHAVRAITTPSWLAVVVFLLAGQASAQLLLEEVIVTATKRASSLQDVPVAVNAFGDQLIQDAGISDASDVAILTPSLNIAVNTSPFTARMQIRGIGTAQTDPALEPSVGLFVDGVFMGRSGLGMSDLTDIERIEVLQGPQGTLYGKNTNAGAISVVTKRPNMEEFEGYVEASIGDYDLGKITVSATGPLSDIAAFRVSANANQRDGYLENVSGEDMNNADDWNVVGKLLLEPSDSLSILFAASHVERDTTCCGADSIQNESVNNELATQGLNIVSNDPYDNVTSAEVLSKFTLDADAVAMVLDYELGAGTFTSITAWNEYEYLSSTDADRSELALLSIQDDLGKGDSFSQELRFTSNTDGDIDYQLGLFYYDQTTQRGDNSPYVFLGNDFVAIAAQQDLALPLPVDFLGRAGDNIAAKLLWENKTLAVFGQTTFHLSDRWHLTAGLRWTEEEKKADLNGVINSTAPSQALLGVSLLSFVATEIDAEFKRTSSDVNWLLNASFDLADDTMLYASVATGSKSGGFNGVNGTIDEREFADESTISYELGVKSTLWDSTFRVNAAAFYTEVEDYQSQQQLPTGAGTRVGTDGEVTVSGIDANFEFLPLPILTLSAGLLYMHEAEITGGPQEGLALPFTAEVSGNVGLMLFFPLAIAGNEGAVYMRTDYSFMGNHVTNASELTDLQDVQDRNLINIKAGWRNDNLNVSLWARNLSDDKYASLTASRFLFSGADAFFLAPPRTIGATLRYDF